MNKEETYGYSNMQMLGLITPIIISLMISFGGQYEISVILILGILLLCYSVYSWKIKRLYNFLSFLSSVVIFEYVLCDSLINEMAYKVPKNLILGMVYLINLLQVLGYKDYISKYLLKWFRKKGLGASLTNSVYEFLHLSKALVYVIIGFMVISIISNLFFDRYISFLVFVNKYLLPILLSVLFVLEFFRYKLLNKLLAKETWYPIIDDQLNVIGKIAQKESSKLGPRYFHLQMRILLMCGNKIYLRKNNSKYAFYPGTIDTPYYTDLHYGEEVSDGLKRLCGNIFETKKEVEPLFLIKNKVETETQKRIVLLYLIRLDDKEEGIVKNLQDGKFWSLNQIKEYMGHKLFSPLFKEELKFLKKVILPYTSR